MGSISKEKDLLLIPADDYIVHYNIWVSKLSKHIVAATDVTS